MVATGTNLTPLFKEIDELNITELDVSISRVNENIDRLSKDYEQTLALMGNPRLEHFDKLAIQQELHVLRTQLLNLQLESDVLQEKKTEKLAEVAEQYLVDLQEEVRLKRQQISLEEGDRARESSTIKEFDEKLEQAVKYIRETTQSVRESSSKPFAPRLTVVPSQVKYVDANLAYRFAELQDEANIHLGFTTLFLGVAIASGISIVVSLPMTEQNQMPIAVHTVASVMSVIVTIVFGVLTGRAMRSAKHARVEIEESAGKEVMIGTHIQPFSESE